MFSTVHAGIGQIWKQCNPNLPFEYHYQEGVFDSYFYGFVQVSQVLAGTSIVMIIISVTGIFGLALLILGKKMKEISVRKVLGANMGNVVFLINKEFLYAIGFAVLAGIPVSWWLTGNLFGMLAVGSTVSFSPLILAFLSLIIHRFNAPVRQWAIPILNQNAVVSDSPVPFVSIFKRLDIGY